MQMLPIRTIQSISVLTIINFLCILVIASNNMTDTYRFYIVARNAGIRIFALSTRFSLRVGFWSSHRVAYPYSGFRPESPLGILETGCSINFLLAANSGTSRSPNATGDSDMRAGKAARAPRRSRTAEVW